MAAVQGNNQSPIISQRFLNTPTYAGDPAPGVLVSTAQVSGSIVQSYGGSLGGILTMGAGLANYYSDKTLGQQLYAGDYQYVQFYGSSAATAAQGCIVFWQNLLNGNFVVTPDAAAATDGLIAGIALAATGKGNYWFIQTRGVANVKFKTGLTNGSPAIGDIIVVDGAPSNTADDPTQSTTLTYALSKVMLGIAWGSVPTSAGITPVMLGGPGPKYYPGA